MEQLTYFILTRKIFESAIWRDDPHILKLFIYLIGNARHSKIPKKYNGFEIKRGELVTSLSLIADDNEFMKNGRLQTWSRSKVSRMLNALVEQKYITLLSDTYGTHISICKYDTYQRPDTYKANTSATELGINCNGSATEVNTNKNDNNVKNDNNDKKETQEFENFWNLYDKKVGDKKKIFKKYTALPEQDKKKIQETLNDYIASTPDKKFRKNPETYLNNHSWNDEIIKINLNGIAQPTRRNTLQDF